MKKNIILSNPIPATTIGIDLSARTFQFCELNAAGQIVDEGQRKLDHATPHKFLAAKAAGARVAFETGSHSAWVRDLVQQMGHQSVVANARELQAVTGRSHRTDHHDARQLARLARVDPAGNNPIAALNAVTGVLIGAPGLLAGATFAPAKAGDIVEAYGTGWGATNPPFGVGVIPNAAGSLAAPYTLTLAGAAVPASNILYAGVAPCCAGLYQVNFTVPSGTASGNQPLVITVAGIASAPHAFIPVQ